MAVGGSSELSGSSAERSQRGSVKKTEVHSQTELMKLQNSPFTLPLRYFRSSLVPFCDEEEDEFRQWRAELRST